MQYFEYLLCKYLLCNVSVEVNNASLGSFSSYGEAFATNIILCTGG